ncbi:MAG TPA: rhodanese-like domain-containing protein [bacterium]|jgi:rhodanese-related sulfurtransferase|nr:rhodanese-like domain-containing protein [bacterium]
MRKALLFILASGISAGLTAYGVSPSQYQAGQAQDAQAQGNPNSMSPGQPGAPQPMPIPGSAVGAGMSPGAPVVIQQPQAVQDYDSIAIPDWAKGWKHYHWDEALAMWTGKKALFCDARSKSEYDQGHIPGAIPLPLAEFDKYYALYARKLKHAKYIVTYCHGAGCQLSNKVAQKLVNDKKFTDVGSFFGGWPMWQQHNMPIETGGVPQPR